MDRKDFERQLNKLEKHQDNFLQAAKLIASILNDNSDETYHSKRYILALFNRSMAIIEGYNTLIKCENFTCIAPLIRVHLDSLIRFNAILISGDPNEIARLVSEGHQINNLKDAGGFKMHDNHLVSELNKTYDWVKDVYKRTSGYVHFSGQHISDMVTNVIQEDQTLTLTHLISKTDLHVKLENWIETAVAMNEISKALYELTFTLFETELKKKYLKN